MTYGCWCRFPLQDMLPMPSIYTIHIDGHKVMCEDTVKIPNVFAKDCQYTLTDLGRTDTGCIGCTWKKE